MRWAGVAIVGLAVMAGSACVPLGMKSGRTQVVWREGEARIERRERLMKFFTVVMIEGPVGTVLLPTDYWLVENGTERHLDHVREHATYDRKTRRYDRWYPATVLGDAAAGRWVLIASTVHSRERADYFLTIFDRERVVREVTLPNCERRRRARTGAFEGLAYNPRSHSVWFMDDTGPGAVDLMTGETWRGAQLASAAHDLD